MRPRARRRIRLTRTELAEKFRRAARDRLSDAGAERAIDMIAHIETLDSTRALLDALRS